MIHFRQEDGDSDDDIEKDGCVSSKMKTPPNIKIVQERRTEPMMLTSLPSPVAKGECVMFQDKGTMNIIVSKQH